MTDSTKVPGACDMAGDFHSEKTTGGLKRTLTPRHLSMIAIGGSIGTGLFVASGSTIAQSGPGGALLAFVVIGAMVFFLMTSLGELASCMPVTGSFSTYASKYVDESFGFALGWNYWYAWAVTIAVDLVAAQIIMAYWFPDVPGYIWSAGFLLIITALNMASVRLFGESEYWFALIKVITILLFIAVGVLMLFGILSGGENAGPRLWLIGDAPVVGGLGALVGVAMIVGFSFQGTEFVGIAAGETRDPGKNVPRAVRQIFWRILLFYVLTILIIGLLIPYNDPSLLRNGVSDIRVSPFTLIFERADMLGAAAVMNAVILTSVLSAGNSGMYASSRMLYSLALEGKAPAIFARLSASGTPRWALLATATVAALCFLTFIFSPGQIYNWLLNTSGMLGFIAWLGIAVSHYRFRRGYVRQGHDLGNLPYVSRFFPFGPIFAFVLCLFVTLGQNYQALLGDSIDWAGLTATYIGLVLFLVIWLAHKVISGSRFVRFDDMSFSMIRSKSECDLPAESAMNEKVGLPVRMTQVGAK
ncbi:Lysine-specific permease [Pseudomonas chlororaphis subsp. aureofaciens]|nr:Lysine-specific permease [Pseudomonas chlororaphis subsp. aureofaciens]AZE04839.1 Lysine-specific permease [Pseudomonas chlororaphis subsp. aureofaciens]SDT06158.1 lysine-specific permease [Pseudomonas chlororaphis]SUD24888.1 putative amino acid transporter [Pseudomonas chlororaphis]